MVFPVVMHGYDSWTTKKAECWRIDAFELWCWRRLLRVPWTARRSNQSILKEISPEYSLEELMLKLKLPYFGHLMEELTHWKRPWCWERLKVGGEGDDRGWDGWMATPTWWTWVWVSSGSWWWTGKCGVLQSMGSQRFGHDWATELNREIPVISILLFFKVVFESENKCRSVISDSFWPHGLYSPWNSLGQNTGVGSPSLLQGLFPTQGLNPGLLHCRQILYQLSHQGSPRFSLLLNNSTFYYE